ncbi:MAG: ABC transporter permease subunit [Verrucomicrobiota bacterium]
MKFLPVVARELRVASRRRGTYLGRVGAAALPIMVACVWLAIFASQFTTAIGRQMYSVLATLAFGYCLLAGAMATSDCISREKREGTLGLLFLTDLKGYDVILGKLVSRSLDGCYGLLSTVPVLSLALLLGGVTLEEVGKMAALFVNTLFFSMAAGVFASTLSRRDREAMFATGCVILLASAGPYAVGHIVSQWIQPPPNSWTAAAPDELMIVSPLYAFGLLTTSFRIQFPLKGFYESLVATFGLSCILLAAASALVQRVSRERASSRVGLRWLALKNRWSYGATARRTALRRRLLDKNPFYWLAARDQVKAKYVWFFIVAMGVIWLWIAWIIGHYILSWDVSFWIILTVFVLVKVWLTSEVCTRVVEDRSSGAFELLLSSPLNLKEMARGQGLALQRQFGLPTLVIVLLVYLLMVAALGAGHYGSSPEEIKLMFWTLMITFVTDLMALKWVGMWQAVVQGQVNRAVLAACIRIMLFPTLLFFISYSLFLLVAAVTGSGNPLSASAWARGCGWWLTTSLLADLFFGLQARAHFLHQLRDLAAERFSPRAQATKALAPMRERLRAARFVGALAFRKWSGWKRWLILGPALAIPIAAGFLSWRHHSIEQRLADNLAELARKGEPVSMAQLRAGLPVVVPQQNAGFVLQKATMQLGTALAFPKQDKGLHTVDWPGPTAALSNEVKSFLVTVVGRSRPALLELHQAAGLTKSRYPIDWQNLPPQIAVWQAISQLPMACKALEYECLLNIEQGDAAHAAEDVATLLLMGHWIGQEPFLVAWEYRRAMHAAAFRALNRLMNHLPVRDEELRRLASLLAQAENEGYPMLAQAMIGERCLEIDELHASGPTMTWGLTPAERLAMHVERAIGRCLAVPESRLMRWIEVREPYIALAKQVSFGQQPEARFPTTPVASFAPEFQGRLAMLEQSCRDQLRVAAEMLTQLRVAQIAVAVERYRVTSGGQIPLTLDALVPRLLAKVPDDPFDQQHLRYNPLNPGYVIYGVGSDGVDNGGAVRPLTSTRTEAQQAYDIVLQVQR